MSGVIEETEDILILMVLLCVVGVLVWLYLKFQSGGAQSISDFLGGGAGEPGSPEYVSGGENLKRWWKNYFGPGNNANSDLPADAGTIPDSYVPPTQDQLQQAEQDASTAIQSYRQNPGTLPFF